MNRRGAHGLSLVHFSRSRETTQESPAFSWGVVKCEIEGESTGVSTLTSVDQALMDELANRGRQCYREMTEIAV